jgi:hypothetical protein
LVSERGARVAITLAPHRSLRYLEDPMRCAKFEVFRGIENLGAFYSTCSDPFSTIEKMRIRFRFNLPNAKDLVFRATGDVIDCLRLSAVPTFVSLEAPTSRRFWVYPLGEPLPH